jgi:Trk K+ transport system NAD-binding subunit
VAEGSAVDGLTVAAGERNGGGVLFIVAIARDGQEPTVRPAADEIMRAGDIVTIVTRPGTGVPSLFSA